MENTVSELCNNLNRLIHEPLFHNFYNVQNELKYNQAFVSIDIIEDSQIAIEEYEKTKKVEGRSTLLIYGLLQSFFLQQDGLYHLYKYIVNSKIEQNDFFDLFSFEKEIRNVRNDIVGHPTNRKNSEFYYIVKGPTTKYRFIYAGYTPEFRKVEVNLRTFIIKQLEFTKKVLLLVTKEIQKKIEMKKEEHKNILLGEMTTDINRNIQLILRGIRDKERKFQGEWGIFGLQNSIQEIKKELNQRYNNNLPIGLSEVFRIINYILNRFYQWQKDNQLFGNDDAEIFLDSLGKQLKELKEMLREIDKEFNN